MRHKSFSDNLLVITDDSGSRLFKIEYTDNKRKLCAVDFLPTSQKFIEVYPEHNLIITPDSLYTLQGKLILSENFDLADIICFPHNLLICPKSNGERNRVLVWNGKEITQNTKIVKLLHNDKYIAVLCENWSFFDIEGNLVLTIDKSTPDIRLGSNMVVLDEVGNHTLYSLKNGECLMSAQQIVKLSSCCDFAVGVDLKRKATIYHDGKISYFFGVSYVDLVDDAQLFYVCYEKSASYSYVMYDYHRLNVFNEGAVIISYDKENHTLLVANPPEFVEYKVSTYDAMNGTKQCCITPYESHKS